jgi:hypothetical protein
MYELEFGEFPGISDETGHRETVAGWRIAGVEEEMWESYILAYGDADECSLPYYHAGEGGLPQAKAWASQFIEAMTPYKVDGWDGPVPRLLVEQFTLTFTVVTGDFHILECDGATADRITARVRFEGGGSITIPAPEDHDPAATVDLRLPHIVRMRRSSRMVPVEQGATG